MATAEELAISLNNRIVEAIVERAGDLRGVRPSLAAVVQDLSFALEQGYSDEQREYGRRVAEALDRYPSEPLTRDSAWTAIDSLTHPIYDLLLSLNKPT